VRYQYNEACLANTLARQGKPRPLPRHTRSQSTRTHITVCSLQDFRGYLRPIVIFRRGESGSVQGSSDMRSSVRLLKLLQEVDERRANMQLATS